MKKILYTFTAIFLCASLGFAQTKPSDLTVQMWVETNATVPFIKLSWVADSSFQGYKVYRKAKGSTSWGTAKATLLKNATSWIDSSAKVGEAYEYYVRRAVGSTAASGFVYSGIEVPPTDFRGRLLIVADNTVTDSLKNEIDRLAIDLRGDGWMVHQVNVSPQDLVDTVKQKIIDLYNQYPTQLKTVLLLGRIPVPYSGDIAPDGHVPDHKGAWPTDGYYGDVFDYDGNWTDYIKKTTVANRSENRNVPGDGKFDQDYFPTELELEIGRVDMAKMTAFGETEIQLMKHYLDKNHEYRKHITLTDSKAIIDDNFGYMGGEAFASNAWRNFPPLVGKDNCTAGDYFGTMRNAKRPYIWSYGTGGGWYTGASGVGNTDSFNVGATNGIFTLLFGSYFGDWDVTNSFLRAPLAAPLSNCLANAWVGRPWWTFHHMGLGENIGLSTITSQNNDGLYTPQNSFFSQYVHIALMGDPSLRMFPIDPVNAVSLNKSHGGAFVDLSWDASTDAVLGYHIYRSDSLYGKYERITKNAVNGTTYTDARPNKGINCYMVRAARLEESPSGSFYNMSEGTFTAAVQIDSVDWQGITMPQTLAFTIYPNPAENQVNVYLPERNGQQPMLKIVDATGRLVSFEALANTTLQQVSIAELSKGIYIVEISSGELSAKSKLVVN